MSAADLKPESGRSGPQERLAPRNATHAPTTTRPDARGGRRSTRPRAASRDDARNRKTSTGGRLIKA